MRRELAEFARDRPQLLALLCASVIFGLCGTYFSYRAYRSCGANKGIAIIISYGVPVVIVTLLTYLFLHERYNGWAGLGVLMILGGVVVIDQLGVV